MSNPSRPFSTDDERSIWEPNSGCLLWLGSVNKQGYGRVRVEGIVVRAHRASYELHKGKIPEGLFVCHTCDNPSCINPNHLYAGTRRQNTDDAVNRNRFKPRKGEENSTAALSNEQAMEVFLAIGSQRQIAKRFGISQTGVSYIKRGKRYLGAS